MSHSFRPVFGADLVDYLVPIGPFLDWHRRRPSLVNLWGKESTTHHIFACPGRAMYVHKRRLREVGDVGHGGGDDAAHSIGLKLVTGRKLCPVRLKTTCDL